MWRRDRDDQSNNDMEKALDRIANSDLTVKAAVRSVAAQTFKQTAPGRVEQQHCGKEGGAAAKPKPKKKAKKRSQMGEAEVVGGIEMVEYVRADGTPGIVIRRKGRRRGVAFARGDFAAFCAFCNTFRKGETMDPIVRKVKARIGG